ncbi:hypothetical protein N9Y14_00570 [Alphaproteobacteria bacterium]|nr:hypothetical protein [Alphaproteobacteria bacterium]MDB2406726.1 hypothetical protein [Alphaproteobacteria bacterium]MDB2540624.1 hypothetical protein [Alphaproteobacteria bacterium]MDB2649017.1 hypothetical protein [Alphaproteobacteria bacterium]
MQPKYIDSVRKNIIKSDEEFYSKFLEKYREKKIVEVGCFNSPLLESYNARTIGYDLCVPTRYEKHDGYKLVDFMEAKLSHREFDVSICKDSHMYFADPFALVRKMQHCSNTVVLSSIEPNCYPYLLKLASSTVKRCAMVLGVRNWDLDYKNVEPLINLIECSNFGTFIELERSDTRLTITIKRKIDV